MITIFRKIRQKMIRESKFSRYILYAIGEIVLVVIGILIALQVNNWNTEQKIANEEVGILKSLLEGLYIAQKESDIEISKEYQLKESLLVALGKNINKPKVATKTIPDSLAFDILWNSNPDLPVLNTYSDIKSTGKLGIIKNHKIRENFSNLELTLSGLTSLIADRLTLQQMRIDEIIVNDVNFVRLLKSMDSSINIDNESQNNYNLIFENQKIRNLLALKLSMTYYAIENRQKLGNEIKELIHLLDAELKNKV